jgi:CHASE2 domain-containing sensor protein
VRGLHSIRPPLFPLLACCFSVCAALSLFYGPFRTVLEQQRYWTSDWRSALLADRIDHFHDKIIIITIDVPSLGGVIQPVPRDYTARLLRAVNDMAPRAIGLDLYFASSQGAEKDEQLTNAIRATKNLVLGAVDATAREFTQSQFDYQNRFLQQCRETPVGYINLNNDFEIVRATEPPLPGSLFPKSFASVLYATFDSALPPATDDEHPIAWLVGPGENLSPFRTISAHNLLDVATETDRAALHAILTGRIALIGIDLTQIDHFRTPISLRTGRKMPGVIVHAQTLAQVVDGRVLSELPAVWKTGFLIAVTIVGLVLSWMFWRRRMNFLSLGVATSVLVVLDALAYKGLRVVLPITPALFVWFIAVLTGHNLRALANWWRDSRLERRGALAEPG